MNLAELDQVGGMAGSSALYSPPLDYDKLEEEMGGEAVATAELAPLTAPDLLDSTPGPDPNAEIRVICKKCESMFFVPARQAGKTIQCEDCLSEIQVPASSDTARSVPLEKHRTGVQSHIDANYHNKMIEHTTEGADLPAYMRASKSGWGNEKNAPEDHARAAVEREEVAIKEQEAKNRNLMFDQDEPATLPLSGWISEMLSVWKSRVVWGFAISLLILLAADCLMDLLELAVGSPKRLMRFSVFGRIQALIFWLRMFLFGSFGAAVLNSIVNGYRVVGSEDEDEDFDLFLFIKRSTIFIGQCLIAAAPGLFFVILMWQTRIPLLVGLSPLMVPISLFAFYPPIICSTCWNGVFWGIASGQVFSTINTKFGDWLKAYFLMAICVVPWFLSLLVIAFFSPSEDDGKPNAISIILSTSLSALWIFCWFMYLRVIATLCRRVCRYLFDEGNK